MLVIPAIDVALSLWLVSLINWQVGDVCSGLKVGFWSFRFMTKRLLFAFLQAVFIPTALPANLSKLQILSFHWYNRAAAG